MACRILRNDKNEVSKVLAKNGKESKLFKDIVKLGYDKETALKKWALVYTPTFKQWFGDSKVVDKNGEPLIVYHGSPSKHDVFKTIDENAKEDRFKHTGAIFTTDKSYTEAFGNNLYPVFLNIKNPKYFSDSVGINSTLVATMYEKLTKEEHDGIIGQDALLDLDHQSEGQEYVVFEPNQIKHALENIGSFATKRDPSPLLNEIKQRFNLVKTDGTVRNIPYMEDAQSKAEVIEKEYPGIKAYVLQDVGGDYIQIEVSPHLNIDNIYHQVESNRLAARDKEIDFAMTKFLKSIGVRLKSVDNIRDKDGKILSVTAKADMVNKLVEYSKGKIGIDTLPEEAAHFMVELLEAEGSPLFTSMMNNIQNFGVYQEVIESDVYQELYKGDINKLKKEAIGKLIAKHLIKQIKGNEDSVNIRRLDGWWARILDFIKSIFGKASSSSYSKAAHMMLNETVNDHIDVKRGMGSITGEYYQAETTENTKDPVKDTITKFNEENENWEIKRVSLEEAGLKEKWFVEEGDETDLYVGRPDGNYPNKIIKGRVSHAVKKHFWKINRGKITDLSGKEKQLRLDNNEMRMTTGTAGHHTLEGLVELYANKKGNRADIIKNSIFTEGQFQILEQGVKDLISQIKKEQKLIDPDGKVIFRTEQMITNRDQSVGGSIDLVAIFSDNSAAIYDYKFVSPSKAAGYVDRTTNRIIEDPFAIKMTTYDLQISQYKKNLIENYGITEIRQSRIVPIHIRFKTEKGGKLTNNITTIQMGTKYSEFLEQIPVAGEMTRFEDINKIIKKLLVRKEGIDKQLQTKKYKAGVSFESLKAAQAKITKQLRVLQIDQDVAYIIKSLKDDIDIVNNKLANNNEFLESGELNPNYLTNQDLNDLLSDLMFYQSIVSLHDYVKVMSKEKQAEYIIFRDRLAGFLAQTITQVQGKMLERTADKAEERGVKGIKSYNLDISWMTSNFVNLSKQTNPYLRNLWEIMNKLNFNKRRLVKIKAEEIQAAQDAFVGNRGIKAFDMLLNKDGSFKSKYSSEYYKEFNSAIKSNNTNWFDPKEGNVQIDEEYYNKKYKEFRAGKLKVLKGKHGENQQAINREIRKWELAHDVKNHLKTASVNKGGQYFLRPADKWISDEYNAIQNDPAAKTFYDLYFKTIKEVEEMYGERLGPNFTADVRKTSVESMFVNGSISEVIDSSIENLQVREGDYSDYGMRDENTNRLLNQIPKLYIYGIRDKNGNIDSSLKTRDLGKGLLLLFDAAVDYQLKNDVLPEIQMMEAILSTGVIDVQSTDMFGDILQNAGNMDTEKPKKLYETYQRFVDTYIYGSTLDAKEITVGGKISGTKSILKLKNFHSITQLGLKTPVAIGAFAAGMFGLEYEASKGTFITRKNLRKAQAALLKADPKMRALVEYLDFYQRNDAQTRADRLSAQYATRHMTNDKWFAFLATADKGIDAITLYSTALNFGVDENGMSKRLDFLPEGSKNIIELMELEQNPLWEGTTTNVSNKAVDRYKTNIKGLSEDGELHLRDVGREISFKVKGNMTDEDKALYNSHMFLRLMMHYKSWLPGIAMARFGKQKYNHILETFDEGTWMSFFSNTDMAKSMDAAKALDVEMHAMNIVKTLFMDGVKILGDVATFGYLSVPVKEDLARARFDVWASNNANNPEFADKLRDKESREEMFQEFLKMKQGNIRAFLMELRITLGLVLLLMTIGGDDDDDGKLDIRQTYAGRKLHNILNRIKRETAVFTQPQEFLDAGRATGIPLLGFLRNGISLIENTVDETRDILTGEAPYTERDRTEKFYYTFKITPGLNALSKGIELFPRQKYEQF